MKRRGHLFEHIVTFDNLLHAARKAAQAKRGRPPKEFRFHLENELLELQEQIIDGTYKPGAYTFFEIRDPKPRLISVAPFRDRVVHHAICRLVAPILDGQLIFDSYACRLGKGSHAAVDRAQQFSRGVSHFLKCDIAKFFESVDHGVLKDILSRKLKDPKLLRLIAQIIDSTDGEKGLPLGNLTSQHFANTYLGELDQFVKHKLRIKRYVRYMDDFALFAPRDVLDLALPEIRSFVNETLLLKMKEHATLLAPANHGVPFLGFKVFPGSVRLPAHKWAGFKRKVTLKEQAYLGGEISEMNCANSVQAMIAHISHADTLRSRRRFFERSLRLG